MRTYLFILFILGMIGCQDDESVFDVSIPKENISFKPVPGGAIMHYKLPANSDVFSIQVKYTDAQGQEIISSGSYACDSLELVGFDEATEGVRAHISLRNHKNEESRAIEMTFDTRDSAPVAFFDKIEVKSHWNGFSLIYESPEIVNGMAHIFYVGKNPLTQEPDTLLLKSFPIMKGRDTLFFTLQQENPFNTVVVRTENIRGYRVKQQIWSDIETFQIKQLPATNITLLDPENRVFENDQYKLGVKYLFDGELKGVDCFLGYNSFQYHTFLAGPDAFGVPFILDLREEFVPANIRFYGILNAIDWTGKYTPEAGAIGEIWNSWYITKLPCEVTVYASNNKDDQNSWEKIGYFRQVRDLPLAERWARRTNDYNYYITNMDDLVAAEPCYMTVEFPAGEKTYRYLKFIIHDTFQNTARVPGPEDQNLGRYFTFNELEVFVKK